MANSNIINTQNTYLTSSNIQCSCKLDYKENASSYQFENFSIVASLNYKFNINYENGSINCNLYYTSAFCVNLENSFYSLSYFCANSAKIQNHNVIESY